MEMRSTYVGDVERLQLARRASCLVLTLRRRPESRRLPIDTFDDRFPKGASGVEVVREPFNSAGKVVCRRELTLRGTSVKN